MIVPVKRHEHIYKMIGTGRAWKDSVMGFIACNLSCDKCGKTTTVYVRDDYYKQIRHLSAGEYFYLPDECILDTKTYREYKSVVRSVAKGLLKGESKL